jgi:NAD(P)-dependent dehydrogenase (short-subunit alcohol dehydrogenase family)
MELRNGQTTAKPLDALRTGLLSGKVCVVSGVGPGLGRHAALQLAAHGAPVVLAARNAERLTAVAEEITAAGGEARAVPTDISDPAQCEALFQAAADAFGGVDVLVNNAFRMDVFQTFRDVDLDRWRKVVETNLFGTLQIVKACLPHLEARGGGSVVMVGSMAARQPPPLEGAYSIAKGGLLTATRVLALELGGRDIRVNAVLPSWMWGPNVRTYVDMTAQAREVDPQRVVDEIVEKMPLRRIPTDEEVAGSIVYLASDLSAALTGQAVDANGGELMP